MQYISYYYTKSLYYYFVFLELSVVGGGLISDTSLDTDPFLLDCDSYDDDPFLTQMWEEGLLGPPNDYTTGIT